MPTSEVKHRLARKDYNARYYANTKLKRRSAKDANDERKVLLSVRLPERLVGRIYRCVNEGLATGRYPWKTAQEAITDLITRGFFSMKGDEFVDEFLPHLEMMQQLEKIHAQRREAGAMLNKARQEINELLGIKAYDPAINYYHVTMDAARKMPATVWRDWLIGQLKAAFPDLARAQVRGVGLKTQQKKKFSAPAAPNKHYRNRHRR